MTHSLAASDITLGVLAGGRASRLGGLDKAWLQREGEPQVLRWQRLFRNQVESMLVSANRDLERYSAIGLHVVADRMAADLGPLAGLDALAHACTTPWLFTLPVDLVGVNECLLPSLIAQAYPDGAFAVDDDGPQPLVGLWRVSGLRAAVSEALASGESAVHALQRRIGLAPVAFHGVRYGNLNTFEDLAAAGIQPAQDDRCP